MVTICNDGDAVLRGLRWIQPLFYERRELLQPIDGPHRTGQLKPVADREKSTGADTIEFVSVMLN